MVALFKEPIKYPQFAKTIFEVFSYRTSAELERIKIENALKSNEKKLKKIFNSSPNAISIVDLDGNIIDCNYAQSQLFGYKRIELKRMNIYNLLSCSEKKKVITIKNIFREKGKIKDHIFMFH